MFRILKFSLNADLYNRCNLENYRSAAENWTAKITSRRIIFITNSKNIPFFFSFSNRIYKTRLNGSRNSAVIRDTVITFARIDDGTRYLGTSACIGRIDASHAEPFEESLVNAAR